MEAENKKLRKWIEKNYGIKCLNFEPTCANCQAWKCYAYLELKE